MKLNVFAFYLLTASFTATVRAAEQPSPAALAGAVLERYEKFSIPERQAAIAGLAVKAETANLLLDAMEKGKIARAEMPSFVARQIANLGDAALTAKLEKAWGRIGSNAPGTEDAAKEHARWKAVLTPDFLRKGKPSQGRALFKTVCATCHTLFGDGAKIGPDLTGSNRADIDYLLENITNPSAVLGKDYELHIFMLKDGQAAAGVVRAETPSAFTLQTLTGEVTVPKAEIKSHEQPGISMMPVGLLTALTNEQARDLIAYLASPVQVPMPGEKGAGGPDRLPGALEGESLKILAKTGSTGPQNMGMWKDGTWSGGAQLWWTGGKPGDRLALALPVNIPGTYSIEAVLTRAPDYGVVKFILDGKPLSDKQIDLFGSKVTNTTQLVLGERELTAGEHRLTVEITGANPEAQKAYMFGIDYLWLRRK
ncbi:MAG TPA: c-type cytochrome [Verrucomicrobiales bacterium]|nr:c-type cytochrome [Verrucomicrobiales bacterium]